MYQARSSQLRLAQVWSDQGQVKVSSRSGKGQVCVKSGQFKVRIKSRLGQFKVMSISGQEHANVRSGHCRTVQCQINVSSRSNHVKVR